MLQHSQQLHIWRTGLRVLVDDEAGKGAILRERTNSLRDFCIMLARTIAIVAVALAAFLFSPLTASAQEALRGFYIGAGAGINFWPDDSDLGSAEAADEAAEGDAAEAAEAEAAEGESAETAE